MLRGSLLCVTLSLFPCQLKVNVQGDLGSYRMQSGCQPGTLGLSRYPPPTCPPPQSRNTYLVLLHM